MSARMKVILTLVAFPAAGFLVAMAGVFVSVGAVILYQAGLKTEAAYILGFTNQGTDSSAIIFILALLIYVLIVFLIWRSLWISAFVLVLIFAIIGVGNDLFHITRWQPFDVLSNIGTVGGTIALFSFSFKITILPKTFWRIFLGVLALDCVYEFFIHVVPQELVRIPNYLIGYNTELNFSQPSYASVALMSVFFPLTLYAAYQLANKRRDTSEDLSAIKQHHATSR